MIKQTIPAWKLHRCLRYHKNRYKCERNLLLILKAPTFDRTTLYDLALDAVLAGMDRVTYAEFAQVKGVLAHG